jgi:predicted transcriptional regulator
MSKIRTVLRSILEAGGTVDKAEFQRLLRHLVRWVMHVTDFVHHQRRNMSDSSVSITKQHLQAALSKWEAQYRAGECLSHEEADALPLEVRAQESADHLWNLLVG